MDVCLLGTLLHQGSVRSIVQLVWYRCMPTSTCMIMHVVHDSYGILLICDAPMCVCVIHSMHEVILYSHSELLHVYSYTTVPIFAYANVYVYVYIVQ